MSNHEEAKALLRATYERGYRDGAQEGLKLVTSLLASLSQDQALEVAALTIKQWHDDTLAKAQLAREMGIAVEFGTGDIVQ